MNSKAKIIALCLFEGAQRIHEQDQQAMMQQPQMGGAAPPPQEQPIPVQNTAGGSDGQPLTVDGLIERLNVIRGGKSFSDPEVFGSLTALFKTFSDQDKRSLDNILLEIGKVVINAETNDGQQQSQTPPAQQASGQGAQPPAPQAGAAGQQAPAQTGGAAPAV